MNKPFLLITFLISFFQIQAQRIIPYPIIFVHGWVGDDRTWYGMGVMLKSQGLKVDLNDSGKRAGDGSIINFNLNADNNDATSYLNRSGGPYYYGDVYDYNSYINPDNDVFFVNFNNPFNASSPPASYSNQAAAAKQGFAVGLAVKKVLNATKAGKVILVGHSMGGLAIREYLQNSINWPFSNHNVAKYTSIGTPHAGSNSNSGGILSIFNSIEWSEAVRDLRYKRDIDLFDRGVYLYGGYEDNIVRLGRYSFFNVDVDCDGNNNGYVVGLNQKSIPTDLAYSTVIGKGGKYILTTTGLSGDDIVEGNRASIFDIQGNAIRYKNLIGDTFVANQASEESTAEQYYGSNDFTWHTKLTKQRFINIYALDEPSRGDLAYEIELNRSYKGFFTPPPPETVAGLPDSYKRLDGDYYRVLIDTPGVLTVNINANTEARASINLFDSNWTGSPKASGNNQLKYLVTKPGYYYIAFSGYSGNGSAFWEFNTYTYNTSFCPMPVTMDIVANGDNSFCEGGSVSLTATQGFDQYKWYKDGILLSNTNNQIVATQSGTYRAEGFKCERSVSSANFVNVMVKSVPSTPFLTVERQPDKFIITSNGIGKHEWYTNGKVIEGANSNVFIPEAIGTYINKVTQNGCSNQSISVTINVGKPSITYTDNTTFFQGDSILLTTYEGNSSYEWALDEKVLPNKLSKLAAKQTGNYRVATYIGKMKSEYSEPVSVFVMPILSVNPTTDGPLKLYPNPNTGKFWVEVPKHIQDWEMTVIDLQGRVLLQKKQKGSNRDQIEVKSHGKFLLRVKADNFSQSLPIVIE